MHLFDWTLPQLVCLSCKRRSIKDVKKNQRNSKSFSMRLPSMYLIALRSNLYNQTIWWSVQFNGFSYNLLYYYYHNQFENIFITPKRNPIPGLRVYLTGRSQVHVQGPGFNPWWKEETPHPSNSSPFQFPPHSFQAQTNLLNESTCFGHFHINAIT